MNTRVGNSKTGLSHLDESNQPAMVDVGDKQFTSRQATARSVLLLPPSIARLFNNDSEVVVAKGPVVATAIIAGTQAVKHTSSLIPFCHPLPITGCKFRIWYEEGVSVNQVEAVGRLSIECTVKVHGQTGVEMEALTGVTVAALTVYDMCKALSHDMVISSSELVHKAGGKSGDVNRELTATR